jgi:hypothetical protein
LAAVQQREEKTGMKNRRSHSPARDNGHVMPLDTVDEALACCQNIATVAGLLKACEALSPPEVLNLEIAARAGGMIGVEVEKLRELVELLSSKSFPCSPQN